MINCGEIINYIYQKIWGFKYNMAITKEKIEFIKRGGIYFTDQVNFTSGQGTLTCGKLEFTSDVDLIDTRINQVYAKHLRPEIILIRNKL